VATGYVGTEVGTRRFVLLGGGHLEVGTWAPRVCQHSVPPPRCTVRAAILSWVRQRDLLAGRQDTTGRDTALGEHLWYNAGSYSHSLPRRRGRLHGETLNLLSDFEGCISCLSCSTLRLNLCYIKNKPICFQSNLKKCKKKDLKSYEAVLLTWLNISFGKIIPLGTLSLLFYAK